MAGYATIITPLDPEQVEACRQYLRDKAEPAADFAHRKLVCPALFPFDQIYTLHFCSFVILDAEADFGPSLIFEATFDGLREEFLRALVNLAPDGFHEVYRHCEGCPESSRHIPEIMVEYLIQHDVGAHTFFSGYPGRSVSQVTGEDRIHSGVVEFLSRHWPAGRIMPARLDGFFQSIRRQFIDGQSENRWAGNPPQLPWEMRMRNAVVAAAAILLAVLACGLGAVLIRCLRRDPLSLYVWIVHIIDRIGGRSAPFVDRVSDVIPWASGFIRSIQPALPMLIGITVVWAIVRCGELFVAGFTKNPRDQFFILRFPLQLLVVLRYALLILLAGSALLALIAGLEDHEPFHPASIGGYLKIIISVFGIVLLTAGIWAILQHGVNSLKLIVELKPLGWIKENLRRAALDALRYLIVLTLLVAALVIVRQTPLKLGPDAAHVARVLVYIVFALLICGLAGVGAAYGVTALMFVIVRSLELRDTRNFDDPAGLMPRAQTNAEKYSREEGGINTFQNHLVSLTYVKSGFLRHAILRLTLFVINLLARFWFNRGDLGGIPTISRRDGS